MLVNVWIPETFGLHLGLNHPDFFLNQDDHYWIKHEIQRTCHNLFAARIWQVWRNYNGVCISYEIIPRYKLSLVTHSMEDSFTTCFSKSQTQHTDNRHISWNFEKYSCIIINIDENCNDTPICIGFGGALHASNGTFQCGLFGFIPNSLNILHAELWIMYQGLSLAKGIGII